MRKGSRWVGLVVSLALIVVMTIGTISAQGAYYRVGRFDIWYFDAQGLAFAKGLAKYIPEAWRAATTVIGNQGTYNRSLGQIQVRTYVGNEKEKGYFLHRQYHTVWLNRYFTYSFAKFGQALSHETSHLLFFNYTYASDWKGGTMANYRTFITESLARYTSDVAYKYGDKYSVKHVKYNLGVFSKQAYGSASTRMTWYGMGLYYNKGGALGDTAVWGQMAVGYFLTGGLVKTTSKRVAKLMNNFQYWSHHNQKLNYLRSYDLTVAERFFEYCFADAYGVTANARVRYGSINNKRYMMGRFYYQWYV